MIKFSETLELIQLIETIGTDKVKLLINSLDKYGTDKVSFLCDMVDSFNEGYQLAEQIKAANEAHTVYSKRLKNNY